MKSKFTVEVSVDNDILLGRTVKIRLRQDNVSLRTYSRSSTYKSEPNMSKSMQLMMEESNRVMEQQIRSTLMSFLESARRNRRMEES